MSDLPVKLDQLAVDGEYGTSPGSPDPGLDLGQELGSQWFVGAEPPASRTGVGALNQGL